MKKMLLFIAITLLLTACQKEAQDNIQTISGIVSSIDSEYIYIDTEDGNGWAIYYEDGYSTGDNITITFNTLGTDGIYDDEIISIEKINKGAWHYVAK